MRVGQGGFFQKEEVDGDGLETSNIIENGVGDEGDSKTFSSLFFVASSKSKLTPCFSFFSSFQSHDFIFIKDDISTNNHYLSS